MKVLTSIMYILALVGPVEKAAMTGVVMLEKRALMLVGADETKVSLLQVRSTLGNSADLAERPSGQKRKALPT